MNRIWLESLNVTENKVTGTFNISGDKEWVKLFNLPYEFKIESNVSLGKLPNSMAVIPFVSNVLPIVWLMDAVLELPELDESFYNSIEEFKKGYEEMYPYCTFKGTVKPEALIKNTYSKENSAVLFSGGADAFDTLIRHIDENPYLITLWGADIGFDNAEGWQTVQNHIDFVSEKFNLGSIVFRTNFRDYTNEGNLSLLVCKAKSGLGWYHDFQHGIEIISHTALVSKSFNIGKVYIASSFTADRRGFYTCASDPIIDNFVKFGSTDVSHDGYECNRQDKIHNIVEYNRKSGREIPMRVCWESKDGDNCCHCEKCYRTIMAVLAEGEDPVKFGFDKYNEDVRKHMIEDLQGPIHMKYQKNRYQCIQNKIREKYTIESCPEDLKWFYKIKLYSDFPKAYKLRKIVKHKFDRVIYRVKRIIKKIGVNS